MKVQACLPIAAIGSGESGEAGGHAATPPLPWSQDGGAEDLRFALNQSAPPLPGGAVVETYLRKVRINRALRAVPRVRPCARRG